MYFDKVTIIWAPQSGTRVVCERHNWVQLGGLGSVVSSPSGVRGRAPAASDFFVYTLYRLQQVSIGIRMVK